MTDRELLEKLFTDRGFQIDDEHNSLELVVCNKEWIKKQLVMFEFDSKGTLTDYIYLGDSGDN